ncbi:RluA family pseudouridine synthase [Sediminicola luteus]|uniref:RNA pseudouridine synthase n=1 Tax=Sediminicola luteus TaxID=319238 RepID=A0A2A4G3U5_9FLAO|nr:RluA family pseudouridine synthase [Sediminicola luteus]PCE62658.1 RNA pseudouridine synthase [Sediminicola luteus]
MSKLDIITENNDFIVVNKTSGLITESSPYESLTVQDQVGVHLSKHKPARSAGGKKPYLGVVHRLDRVTSGVLLFAKKKSVLVAYNQLFSSRKVQKTYLALVSAKPEKKQARLENYLVKLGKEKKAQIVATKTKEAQLAQLSYRLIGKNAQGYLLEVRPRTGRFHQIRAQLAHIGLPIVGDVKYGSTKKYLNQSICLHAWKLKLTPAGGQDTLLFEAPLPKNKYWVFERLSGG